jgi:glycosyltransferase involved in cell wall biosynthesis
MGSSRATRALRVGLDVSPLDQTRAGTARHIAQLRSLPGVEIVPLRCPGRGRAATLYRDVLWYPALLPRASRRLDLDLLHCPTFRGPLAPPSLPLVVTVHDLAILRHPDTFNPWTRRYSRYCVPRVARAASMVIAVSEFTRRELIELLRLPEQRIRVVPNGVAEVFRPQGPAETGEYVLAVGTLEPRKNLERLAEAARRLRLELRVAGARGWGRVRLPQEGVRLLGEVSDDELAALYRGALCLAYPSLYEGFGLPILEAMACGTPVVTSAGGATEEVAGGAAVLVDPRDVDSIARGLEEALARREELRRRGLERAKGFTWQRTASATAAVYREAIS